MSALGFSDGNSHDALISVVIPVFNGERFVSDAIASALASDLVAQVIAVDDGSTDGTAELLAGLAQTTDRLTVKTQRNSGVSAARNAGFEEVVTPFTCFLDHDDLLIQGGLERLCEALTANPAAPAVYGRIEYIDGSSRKLALGTPRRNLQPVHLEDVLQSAFIDTTGAVLIRSDIVSSCGMFDKALTFAEDWEFYVRVAALGPILPVDEKVLAYRQHGMSAMHGDQLEGRRFDPAIERVFAPGAAGSAQFDAMTLKRFELRKRAGVLRRLGQRRQSGLDHLSLLAALCRMMSHSGFDWPIVKLFSRAVLSSGKRILTRT